MIRNSIVISGLLLWIVGIACASSAVNGKDVKEDSLWSFNAKVKLLNDWNCILQKSIHSYIPYHEENGLFREPEWMYNSYCSILKKNRTKYDVFYADVSEYEPSNFLFIKNNIAFVYTPYLKISGCKEKIYDLVKLKSTIENVEEELFQEKNPQKVMELVRKLCLLKEAPYEIESYSKRLPEGIAELMVKIMKNFQELHPKTNRLEGYELDALYNYMWSEESLVLKFYGFESSVFGVSIRCFTASGSPTIYVGSIFNDLIRYVKSEPSHEQMDLDWLRREIKELPFVKDCN